MKRRVKTIREIVAVKSIAKALKDYSKWYDEEGLYLPPNFARDPSGWSEALHRMSRAFTLLSEEIEEHGELWMAKNSDPVDNDRLITLEDEIKEGLKLFGENIYYMNDPKIGNI